MLKASPLRRSLLSALALSLVAVGCAEREPPQQLNIVFVAIDTLRADHVGAYGYERGTTPFLDELAGRSVVAETMVAQCPWTKPSVASIFTSLLPSQHEVHTEATNNGLDDSLVTLAEVLQYAGYRTACFSANPHIAGSTGFHQGFDTHAVPQGFESDVTWALTRASDWLDDQDESRPFFLYLQVLDPHDPYDPQPEVRERFVGERESEDERVLGGQPEAFLKSGAIQEALTEEDLDYLRALYDSELSETDAALRSLYADLERRGALENTIFIVTSDHGEEFLDHGTLKHGYQLYEEMTRVPLILGGPTSNRSGSTPASCSTSTWRRRCSSSSACRRPHSSRGAASRRPSAAGTYRRPCPS